MYLTGTLLSRFAALPRIYALLAQSVEHFHGKEKVVGSIPTEGSAIWLARWLNDYYAKAA